MSNAVQREPIAIVGIGCRFPSSAGPSGYWKTLCEGKDTVGPIPKDRWDSDELFDPDPTKRGKMITRSGGFLDDIRGFDWRAFRVSPREAKYMDPQHRLLLEVAWEAFEDAGIPFEKMAGTRTAVFVGIMWNDYSKLQSLDLESIDGYSAAGNAFAFAANRISFFFDLKGPSVALDVSCASSLIAVHQGCESIWSGESTMAIAGGVNLIISPDCVIAMSKAGILSAEGHCKPFDASADGFVRGEGAGLVLLKPLSLALADGDRIHAIIRGTAATHSGKTDWIMAPSSAAQEDVYREAYRRAGVDPKDVDYVELHGTGTRKGDPLEAKSVAQVMGAGSGREGRCIVGSVKTNLGHLDSAAGIAGLIKTALALEHRQIPGSLHLKNVNPEIDLDALGLDFKASLSPWPEKSGPALAGVTGLSFGGANVHIVLEEPPRASESACTADEPDAYLLPLSARADGALRALGAEYRARLAAGVSPRALCAAASHNRTHHPQRLAVAGRTASELMDGLDRALAEAGQSAPPRGNATYDAPVFVFTGQGPQWWGMGRELYEREPVFRATMERCDAAVRRHAPFSLLEELRKDEASSGVQETHIAQPVIFALQVSLCALLASWGVEPRAVIGHSAGEIAAAHVAGALSLESAARLAACRGRIMHAASHLGRMVLVAVSRDEALNLVAPFAGRIEIAVENAPRSIVLSGETDAIHEVVERMKEQGITARLLPGRYAFHSAIMTRFQPELIKALEGIEPREPSIPIVSTLLGRCPSPEEAFTPAYWARQMREPVEYSKAVSFLAREGRTNFVEIGPHPVLATATAESLGDARARACVLPTLVRGEPERAALFSTLGALYSRGQSVAWSAVAGRREWAPLPTYPWQKEKLWIDVAAPAPRAAAKAPSAPSTTAAHPLLQVTSKLARPSGACLWEAVLDLETMPYLRGHRLAGSTVVPASLFVEMAVAAAVEATASCRCVLRDVELLRALILSEEEPARVQLLSTVDDGGATRLEIWSRPEKKASASWVLHVTAVLEASDRHEPGAASLPATDGEALSGANVYAAFHRAGEEYGEAFQGIKRLWRKDSSEIVAELTAPATIAGDVNQYVFHPALLDACMHCMAAARAHDGESGFMPTRFERIEVLGKGGAHLWARALVSTPGAAGGERLPSGTSKASITIVDEQGVRLLDIQGVTLQDLDALGASHRAPPALDLSACYEVAWRSSLPSSKESDRTRDSKQSFIVLGSAGEHSALFCNALEQMGHSVLRADPSATALAALLEQPDSTYHGVLFLAASDPAATASDTVPDSALCLRVIDVLRTIAQRPPGTEPRLFVVTRGGQALGRTAVLPTQGLLWGLGRSAAAEYPSFWGGIIDAPADADDGEAASHVCNLVTQGSDETELLSRGGASHVARLAPLGPRETPAPLVLSRDVAYLVTGGFGAIGQTFARWLIENGAQHVVLLSRSAPSAEHARIMGELTGLGGSVYHAVADVADEKQMRGALAALARDGVPEIRGVLHAAGTVFLKPIAEVTEADVEGVFRSKVVGSWVLDRIFADAHLQFFVLFSSASAILQSASLGPYAAANAYQDALAHARRARGEHGLTVNWGPWAGEGMAKDTGEGRGPLALRGMGAITSAQGTALLHRFLELDLTQVSVLPIHWATFRAAYPSFDRAPLLSELRDDSAPESKPKRLSVLPGGNGKSRRERIEQYLLHRAARALHAEPHSLNAESTLIELGLDSLMLVELRLEIERALGVRLRLMDLLSDPSIRELSTSLEPHVKEVA